MKSMKLHQGAIFTTGMEGKWLFTRGWDKILKVQVHMKNMVFVCVLERIKLKRIRSPRVIKSDGVK